MFRPDYRSKTVISSIAKRRFPKLLITNSSPPTASDTTGFTTLYLTSAYDGTTTIETGKLIESRTRILGTADWLEVDYNYDSYGRTNATSGNNHLDLTTGSETVFTTPVRRLQL